MTPPDESVRLPGAVRQFGYVVADLDQAIASWLGVGVGPWYVMRDIPQRALYRGEPCEVTLSVGFANSGDMQIELIQQADDTPEHLHRISRRPVPALFINSPGGPKTSTRRLQSAQSAGWPVVWTGTGEDAVRYAYLEPPAGPAAIVEIMELNELSGGMGTLVREAAAGWDGSDPIRSLGYRSRQESCSRPRAVTSARRSPTRLIPGCHVSAR